MINLTLNPYGEQYVDCRPNEKPHYLHFWSKLSFLYRQIRKKISYLMAQTEF